MKKSAVPMSSPGRSEKYPMPLMRFLRSNGGSRSRSRSRSRSKGRSNSSPMFVWKKNTTSETQEPSSPTVTCMGQVRVRRPRSRGKTGFSVRRRCRWIRDALFCHHKINPKCIAFWRKWVLFFKAVFGRNGEIREDPLKSESKFGSKTEDSEKADENVEEDEAVESMAKVVAPSPSSPPKNALLLTRCRSAPYRSSSLAGRYWSSPIRNSEAGEGNEAHQGNREIHSPIENSTSRKELIPDEEPTEDQKRSVRERIIEPKVAEERGSEECAYPLILTRCKSEPARTGGKPEPEVNYWRKRKIGYPTSSSLLPTNL